MAFRSFEAEQAVAGTQLNRIRILTSSILSIFREDNLCRICEHCTVRSIRQSDGSHGTNDARLKTF